MRLRPLIVGAALCGLVGATPAAANHLPFYGWMGIIEITSTAAGTNVSYTYSGFAPTNWSNGCTISSTWNGSSTAVSCTPPQWPGTDINYCAILSVTVSSTAPAGPGTITGSSACENVSATATTGAGGTNASGNTFVSNLQLEFPWTCTAQSRLSTAVHPWTVRCTVSH